MLHPAQGSPTEPAEAPLSSPSAAKYQALSRVWALASDETAVDHPMCRDCAEVLQREIEAQAAEAEDAVAAYRALLDDLRTETRQMEAGDAAQMPAGQDVRRLQAAIAAEEALGSVPEVGLQCPLPPGVRFRGPRDPRMCWALWGRLKSMGAGTAWHWGLGSARSGALCALGSPRVKVLCSQRTAAGPGGERRRRQEGTAQESQRPDQLRLLCGCVSSTRGVACCRVV